MIFRFQEGHVLSGHAGYINAIEVDADGDQFLSCASDGAVRVWRGSSMHGNAEPPYAFGYGGGRSEVAACAEGGRFLLRVGEQALAWSVEGQRLGKVAAGWSGGPDVRVHGGELTIEAGGEAAPRELRVLEAASERVLDVVQLDAAVLAMAAIDDRLATLDEDGHVTIWRVAAPG